MRKSHAILIADLGFGDGGKGTTVDFLTRCHDADLLVRYNGGPQAGHNVVTPEARHHTFSQFGSGTFVPGARTLLSRFMLIEPYALCNEAAHLAEIGVPDAMKRLTIDERCAVITPAHQAANRIRELFRQDHAHGTCGMGVGETAREMLESPDLLLRASELNDRQTVKRKLLDAVDRKASELASLFPELRQVERARFSIDTLLDPSWVNAAVDNYADLARNAQIVVPQHADRLIRESRVPIFEGAQGVLLDEHVGFHPHTTWSSTTFANAHTLLNEACFEGLLTRLAVTRTYCTRHGQGPMVSEVAALSASLPEPHNSPESWQGRFRVGVFDAVAARYALAALGTVDGLVLTHTDRIPRLPRAICSGYRFASDSKVTCSLPAIAPADLDSRERLTRSLFSCRPHLKSIDGEGPNDFVRAIQNELRCPVVMTCVGPTFLDKRTGPTIVE